MHQAAAELLSCRIWMEEIFRISRQLAEPKYAGQRYRLLWRRQQLVRRCLAINRRLNTMPPLEGRLLRCRYIQKKIWPAVAETLGCSQEQADWLHKRAFGFIETSNRRPGKPALPRTCGPALKAAWNFRRQTLNGVTYGEESLYPTGA